MPAWTTTTRPWRTAADMAKAWVVTGGNFDISRNSASWSYDLVSMGRAIADTPPPTGALDFIALHSYFGIPPGEGGGGFVQKQSVLFYDFVSSSPAAFYQFDDPVGSETWIDETTAGPNDQIYLFGGDLYAMNYPIMFDYNTFPTNDEMHIRFQKASESDVIEGVFPDPFFADFDFTETIPFNNDGFSDWRGPFFLIDKVYFWFMDAETERVSLWVNSLNTPTDPWVEAYGEDAAVADQYYIVRVVMMITGTAVGRLVAVSNRTVRPHVLYSDDDGATFTPVDMDAGFNPLEFGIHVTGSGLIAFQRNSSTLQYWYSPDGVAGWMLNTPTVSGSDPFVIKATSKVFTNGLYFLVTTYLDSSGHMGPLALFGTLGGFSPLTAFPDYAGWTDTERHYSNPHVNWAFWHSGRGSWFLNVIASPYGSISGYDYLIEYSADMSTEVRRINLNVGTGAGFPPIDGITAFQGTG
jgi:hypothetical protein